MNTEQRVTALLVQAADAARLPTQAWLEEHLAVSSVDTSLIDERRMVQLRRAFPELPYLDPMLAKLWALYEDSLHSNELRPSRDALGFVHLLLGLPKCARKGRPLDDRQLAIADAAGQRIETDLLAVA